MSTRAEPDATARDVLEAEERQAVVLAHLKDLDNVGVLKPGNGLRLAPEPRQLVGPGRVAGADHLERDGALQGQVPGLVDDAHASAAEHFLDLVARNRNRS